MELAQIVFKLIFTAILLWAIFLVWTNDIDLKKTLLKPLFSIVQFKKNLSIDTEVENTVAAQFPSGKLGLIFYNMKIINTLESNMTVKQVLVRYSFDGKQISTDSQAVVTSPVDSTEAIVLRAGGGANIVLQ
jgi:hypothetical protein